LVTAAARFDVGFHLLLVIFDGGYLPDDNFCLGFYYPKSAVGASNKGLHLILYPSPGVV
jgi:hypothetical protein